MNSLSNGISYPNAHFKPEFGEYLIANDFSTTLKGDNLIFTEKEIVSIVVFEDNLNVFAFDKHEKSGSQFAFHKGFSGINSLDMFDWIMLMHVMDVIPIYRVANAISAAQKESLTKIIESKLN